MDIKTDDYQILSPENFIKRYVGAIYADDNDQLIVRWSKLSDRDLARNIANYVFDGFNDWEQREDGFIKVYFNKPDTRIIKGEQLHEYLK